MDVFVTRQPIFDTRNKVVAYELLHRGADGGEGDTPAFLSRRDSEDETELGVKDLTGGKTAFVTVSRESLLGGGPEQLDPRSVVIQLPKTLSPDDEVMGACKGLASAGFRFALGDAALHEKYAGLLRSAEVVRIDVQESVAEEKVALAEKLGVFKGKLLAEGVENQTAHEYCRALGIELFQGFHYSRPETLTNRDLSSQSVSVVRILNMLKDPNSPDRDIHEAFRSDPGLSYKLLALVNSAALGGRGIDSIPHAMRLLGRDPLYRWLSMLLLAEGKDRTDVKSEIVKSSLLRGRMCELLGESCPSQSGDSMPSGGTLFLVGLFSQLDTLLQMPMDSILSRISLANGVEGALLGREGPAGGILSVVENYEEAEWNLAEERLTDLGADPENLSNVYLDSVTWASNRMDQTGD